MTKRPEKPRLEWKKVRGVNTPRHRTSYTENGKRRERTITLDWQGDLERLDQLYWQCERGLHPQQKPRPGRHTWGKLIAAWKSDPRVQKKTSASTRKSYRPLIERLLIKNADKNVDETTRQHVRKIHEMMAGTPRQADKMVGVIRMLWNYGRDKLDWPLGDNPASGIDAYGPSREFEPWPEWMVSKLDTAPHDVKVAAELILCTGQRPNAAITMQRKHFDGEWMSVLDEKAGARIEVYCPVRLQDFIANTPKSGAYVLSKNLTEPKGYNSVEKQFRAWRSTLGETAKPYVLHGLRKLAIIQLAEAGCSDAEIQAVTNQSAEMVAFYRSKASQRRLSKTAQQRRERNENET